MTMMLADKQMSCESGSFQPPYTEQIMLHADAGL